MVEAVASRRRAEVAMAGRIVRCCVDRLSHLVRALLFLGLFAFEANPAKAEAVDLRLVLAVDASGSVNQERFEIQKSGYEAAFRNIRVLRAIQSGAHGKIAVTMVHWTGPALQVQVMPWWVIRDEASMANYAEQIAASQRRLFSGGTSISGAIDYGARLIAECPHTGTRSVIDVSGDGGNNRGRSASSARDEAIAAGIVINGLPILELDPSLDEYYLNNVIGGPNSFMVPAQTFEDFADAVLKKLITEIADLPVEKRLVAFRAREVCHRC
jgi:hypothetical protein